MRSRRPRVRIRVAAALGIGAALVLAASPARAGPREQARRIHDRLVGVPPSAAVLDAMAAQVAGGDPIAAAYQAMQNPAFYSMALRNFATPWTNVARTPFADLNDYSATVIGMVRDDVPFDQVLSADLVYVGAPGVVGTAYSHTNNDHYAELQESRANLGNPAVLVSATQSGLAGAQLTAADTAGVITTRAGAEAFFSAGTNRRMLRFVSMNFLCRDLEQLKDNTRPTGRIRQDVSRSPGGDARLFLNNCVGCHSGMDPMAGAFAYYEFDATLGRLVFTPGVVQGKFLINANTFPQGYQTVDDRWDNYWRTGPNSALGWRGTETGGFGAKSFGREIAGSRAFSTCQVEKVFRQVCFHPPQTAQELAEVERIATVFESQSYSMKRVFAEVAATCRGN